MSERINRILFESFRAIGSAFYREAHNDPSFNSEYKANRDYWVNLTQGLMLSTFCHLVETEFGGKEGLKSKLKTNENKEILDIIFIVRNSFIHCNWDISKLNFKNQEDKIREFLKGGVYTHPDIQFELRLDGDIVKSSDYEPMCRVLLSDI